jgi:glycosyltransferase involved in cell wall biosynthesis
MKEQTVEWGRLHYSSSADRGLDNIIYILPFIIQTCPDVTLHIYYGWNTWLAAAKSRGNKDEMQMIEDLQRQLDALGDRVVMHGRVSQQELAEAWTKAWCWLYPTNFSETFCITAKEAQNSATPIVCSNVGALQTTVGDSGKIVKPFPYSKEAREEYIIHVRSLYHDRDLWKSWSDKSLAGFAGSDWPSVYAKDWAPLLQG